MKYKNNFYLKKDIKYIIIYMTYDANRYYLIVKVIDFNGNNYLVKDEPLTDKKQLMFNYTYIISKDNTNFKIGDILKVELSYNSEILEIAPAQITHIHKIKKVDTSK